MQNKPQKLSNFLAFLPALTLSLSLLSLGACTPYQQQIQQGNIISTDMINKLTPNMTKEQVAYLLGTPDIQNPWNSDQWYYVYTNKEEGQSLVKHRLVLDFKDDKLSHIEGNYAPPSPLQYTVVEAK